VKRSSRYPTETYVKDIQDKLGKCHDTILRACVVEIGESVSKIEVRVDGIHHGVEQLQDDAARTNKRLQLKDERELLDRLIPPKNSLYYGKPGCLAGTRVSMIEQIRSWATDGATSSRLFWLYGVAGCGKSSLAASVAEGLQKQLAGSFFCKLDQDERRDPVRLIWTIAFYLAGWQPYPPYRQALLKALEKPDAFVNCDLKSQFESLVEQPLNETKSSRPPPRHAVFVVDALDECDDYDRVAPMLSRIIQLAPWVKLVVTSRPLPGISRAFQKLGASMKSIDLFDENARDDIRRLLEHELSSDGRLSGDRLRIEGRKEQFVARSQGLFIWLDTIIKFIQADEANIDAVDQILGMMSFPEAEAGLYALYRTVVDTASSTKTSSNVVKMILGFVLASSTTAALSAKAMHAFLPPSYQLPFQKFQEILGRLNAILLIGDNIGITVTHTSVLDFFGNKSQCGKEHWIDPIEVQQIMASGCFEIMKKGTRNPSRQQPPPPGLRFNICSLQTSHLRNDEVTGLKQMIEENVSPELRYSCMYWPDHLIASRMEEGPQADDTKSEILAAAIDFLCSTQSLYWLEAMTLFDTIPRARDALFRIDSLLEVR
jgi:hypothetical protein